MQNDKIITYKKLTRERDLDSIRAIWRDPCSTLKRTQNSQLRSGILSKRREMEWVIRGDVVRKVRSNRKIYICSE